MIPSLTVPDWVKRNIVSFHDPNEIPESIFSRIREGLSARKAEDALATIGVIAFNEQSTILSCLASLAEQKTSFPLRIVVSNNNSTDQTQKLLDRCGALSVLETRQGIGFARQAAMDLGRGKYYLCADADCMYPPPPGPKSLSGHCNNPVFLRCTVWIPISRLPRTGSPWLFMNSSGIAPWFFAGSTAPS
jgi:cellulose synthase/poly-beta-1,6-N-acetylglucosamine synthase-like glycosyltransferase